MKTTRIKKKKRKLMDNRGTTLVESLVAFAILTTVMLMLYGMVRLSMNLRMRAVDTSNLQSSFNSEIYKTNPSSDIEVYYYIGKRATDHLPMFSLKLSDTTKNENLLVGGESSGVDRTKYSTSITIPNIDGKAYVSTDSIIDEENLVIPKVIMFSYYKRVSSGAGNGSGNGSGN